MMVSSKHSLFADELCNENVDLEDPKYNPVTTWNMLPKFVWEENGVEYIGFDEQYFKDRMEKLCYYVNELNYSKLDIWVRTMVSYVPIFNKFVEAPMSFDLKGTKKEVLGKISIVFGYEDYQKEMEKIQSKLPDEEMETINLLF